MEVNTELNYLICQAYEEKKDWYRTSEITNLQKEYRTLHTNIRQFFDTLEKRGLITKDPYKNVKKINDVAPISSDKINPADKDKQIGERLSEYESMLAYISDFLFFDISAISIEKIKKLMQFNMSFDWNNISESSKRENDAALADCIAPLRRSNLTAGLVKNHIDASACSMSTITVALQTLLEFKREEYKVLFRQNIIFQPEFPNEAFNSKKEMFEAIVKANKESINPSPVYEELISQLIDEIIGSNSEGLSKAVLEKIQNS